MVNLKKSLNSILNSKNYKFIIYLLIGFILIFLICGNYNLIEGITVADKRKDLNDINNIIRNKESKYQEVEKDKFDDVYKKANIIRNKLPFSNLEGFTLGINSQLGLHKAGSTANKARQQYKKIKT